MSVWSTITNRPASDARALDESRPDVEATAARRRGKKAASLLHLTMRGWQPHDHGDEPSPLQDIMSAPTYSTHAWGSQPEMFGPRHEHRLAMFTRETEMLPPRSRVLDAAVGLGQLASRVKRQGHEVFGVDASFEAVLHARRHYGIRTVLGDLTKLPFRTGVFDAVTSGETLEHLDDDRSAISEIGRIVRDDGTVIVTVPALQSLWTASDDYYEHRRRYTSAALSNLFREASFSIRTSKYWGFPIVLTYDTLFLLPMNKRRAKLEITEDTALQSVASAGKKRWLVNIVRAIFSLDRLFSFIPFGPGLLLIAHKEPGSQRP